MVGIGKPFKVSCSNRLTLIDFCNGVLTTRCRITPQFGSVFNISVMRSTRSAFPRRLDNDFGKAEQLIGVREHGSSPEAIFACSHSAFFHSHWSSDCIRAPTKSSGCARSAAIFASDCIQRVVSAYSADRPDPMSPFSRPSGTAFSTCQTGFPTLSQNAVLLRLDFSPAHCPAVDVTAATLTGRELVPFQSRCRA